MKTLVVYYTRTGNTETVGKALAKEMGADIEPLVDNKDRSGIVGWIKSGRDATRKTEADIAPPKHDPSEYDLIIIGTPIWAYTMAGAIRTYLSKYLKGGRVAFFCTHGGNPGDTFKHMEELAGKPVATMDIRDKEVKAGNISGPIKDLIAKLN